MSDVTLYELYLEGIYGQLGVTISLGRMVINKKTETLSLPVSTKIDLCYIHENIIVHSQFSC